MTPRSTICAFAALLVPALTAQAVAATRSPQRAHPPAPPARLLYVSMEQRNEVVVYDASSQHARPLRRITNGIWTPGQIAVDAAGNLYVPNLGKYFDTANLAVYAPGASAPTATYTTSLTFPVAAAVDSHGNMFVANECNASCQGPGNILEFVPGNPTPIATLADPSFRFIMGLAVDARDDLYVSYFTGQGGAIAAFRGTSSKPHFLNLDVSSPSGMAFDAKHELLVADASSQGYGVVKVFHLGVRRPARQIAQLGYLVPLAFNADRSLLYTGDQDNNVVEVYSYPKVALVNLFSAGMARPVGVAVFPPAPY
jgi:DNA-binding beta-propeller fold protein YncE